MSWMWWSFIWPNTVAIRPSNGKAEQSLEIRIQNCWQKFWAPNKCDLVTLLPRYRSLWLETLSLDELTAVAHRRDHWGLIRKLKRIAQINLSNLKDKEYFKSNLTLDCWGQVLVRFLGLGPALGSGTVFVPSNPPLSTITIVPLSVSLSLIRYPLSLLNPRLILQLNAREP